MANQWMWCSCLAGFKTVVRHDTPLCRYGVHRVVCNAASWSTMLVCRWACARMANQWMWCSCLAEFRTIVRHDTPLCRYGVHRVVCNAASWSTALVCRWACARMANQWMRCSCQPGPTALRTSLHSTEPPLRAPSSQQTCTTGLTSSLGMHSSPDLPVSTVVIAVPSIRSVLHALHSTQQSCPQKPLSPPICTTGLTSSLSTCFPPCPASHPCSQHCAQHKKCLACTTLHTIEPPL